MRNRILWTALTVAFSLGMGYVARSQPAGTPKKDDSDTISVWVTRVFYPGGRSDDIGESHSYDEARDKEKKWEKANPKSDGICTSREITIRRPRAAPGAKTELPELPKNAKPGGGIEKATKWITVTVYKFEDGKWVKQPERTFNTESDYDAASKYYQRWRAMPGWNAFWNARGFNRPVVTGAESKTVDPGAYKSPNDKTEKKPEEKNCWIEWRFVLFGEYTTWRDYTGGGGAMGKRFLDENGPPGPLTKTDAERYISRVSAYDEPWDTNRKPQFRIVTKGK